MVELSFKEYKTGSRVKQGFLATVACSVLIVCFPLLFQRVHNKRVNEVVFFRLVQYLAICLFECNEADDYVPAKTLMNMCFTFFFEGNFSCDKYI